MQEYKIVYSYTTPRGLVIKGKCFTIAQDEEQAISLFNSSEPYRKKTNFKIINIKRINN